MLKGKNILLGVCGGISIYKVCDLASQLTQSGAIVKTVMTASAMEFVSPLTFRSVTKETVSHKLFDSESPIYHISLSDFADLIVIAPATANIIGKIANGIADDLLTTVVLAADCPKLIVPAMNHKMYTSPPLQENLQKLGKAGYIILDPDTGMLACGTVGKGRLPSVTEILYAIKTTLYHTQDFTNKRVLVTAGASVEMIDPVRCISNISSGQMGVSLARAAYLRGAEVTLVHSQLSIPIPYYLHSIEALSAQDMHKAVTSIFDDFDIVIMCAAVADYTPQKVSETKIKKADDLTLHLTRTPDILYELGRTKRDSQYLVGFALESENLTANATEKLKRKNLDMIVANPVSSANASHTEVVIIKKDTTTQNSITGDKFYLAHQILNEVIK